MLNFHFFIKDCMAVILLYVSDFPLVTHKIFLIQILSCSLKLLNENNIVFKCKFDNSARYSSNQNPFWKSADLWLKVSIQNSNNIVVLQGGRKRLITIFLELSAFFFFLVKSYFLIIEHRICLVFKTQIRSIWIPWPNNRSLVQETPTSTSR